MPIITQNLAAAITSLELASELGQPTSFQAKLAVEELRDLVRLAELVKDVEFTLTEQSSRDAGEALDALLKHWAAMRARWDTVTVKEK